MGRESTSSSTWMTAPSRLWSAGAAAALTVFDAGRHRAQSAASHAAFDEAVADYRATVLRAYQEVEDELAALRQLSVEAVREDDAVRATEVVLQQAEARYKAGAVTYLEVVAAENASLKAASPESRFALPMPWDGGVPLESQLSRLACCWGLSR